MVKDLCGFVERQSQSFESFATRISWRSTAFNKTVDALGDERLEFGIGIGVYLLARAERQADESPDTIANFLNTHRSLPRCGGHGENR